MLKRQRLVESSVSELEVYDNGDRRWNFIRSFGLHDTKLFFDRVNVYRQEDTERAQIRSDARRRQDTLDLCYQFRVPLVMYTDETAQALTDYVFGRRFIEDDNVNEINRLLIDCYSLDIDYLDQALVGWDFFSMWNRIEW